MQEKKSTPARKRQTAPSKPKPASDGGKCECVGAELGLGHEADCQWPEYLSDLDEESEL